MHRYSHNGNYFPEPVGAAAGCQREAPLTFVSLDGGLVLGIKGFVAANLGGRGSHRGAVMGGLAFGVLERLSAGYIASTYKDSSAFALFTLILAICPAGLFRSRGARARQGRSGSPSSPSGAVARSRASHRRRALARHRPLARRVNAVFAGRAECRGSRSLFRSRPCASARRGGGQGKAPDKARDNAMFEAFAGGI